MTKAVLITHQHYACWGTWRASRPSPLLTLGEPAVGEQDSGHSHDYEAQLTKGITHATKVSCPATNLGGWGYQDMDLAKATITQRLAGPQPSLRLVCCQEMVSDHFCIICPFFFLNLLAWLCVYPGALSLTRRCSEAALPILPQPGCVGPWLPDRSGRHATHKRPQSTSADKRRLTNKGEADLYCENTPRFHSL